MRFFTRYFERPVRDPQECAAMLFLRLQGLLYRERQYLDGKLAYAFCTDDLSTAVELWETGSTTELDLLVKRDPQFPYCRVEVMPTIGTDALVEEIQGYIGEVLFAPDQLPTLRMPRKPIEPDATYYLAWKEVLPFSPLLSQDEQDDVHRRTLTAQAAHFADLEFADDNPVGRPVGILIGKADLETIRRHVESCDVFPDTIVSYQRLLTLKQSWAASLGELCRLRRLTAARWRSIAEAVPAGWYRPSFAAESEG
jgi:hypothetical protein